MKKQLKLFVLGDKGHGKNEVARILSEHLGLKEVDVTSLLVKEFILDDISEVTGYKTVKEVMDNKDLIRPLMKESVDEYNRNDLTRSTRLVFNHCDMYIGCRERLQVLASKEHRLCDMIIFVDAHKRLPPEPKESNTITSDIADYVLDNNGTKEQLLDNMIPLISELELMQNNL